MKKTRLNIVYDLPLKKIKLSPITIENNKILQPIDKIYFVICNSCYWCASYFGIDDLESLSGSSSHVLDCHVCNSQNTELMPISNGESFRIGYSLTRGMEMEFYKSNKVVSRQESVNALVRPG
ncbi:MAG: hypothetical protein ACRD5J_05510 [Nitrososphaeraceae archaeon]